MHGSVQLLNQVTMVAVWNVPTMVDNVMLVTVQKVTLLNQSTVVDNISSENVVIHVWNQCN